MPETTMPETVVDEPGIADSPIASIDPKDAARAMAVEAAEDENGVGEFVEAIDAGDGITDYRFVSLMRGYEGWQWSVTMFHDVERDTWTVNESTLIPMEQALRPPEWIPWKDRLLPTDLSVMKSRLHVPTIAVSSSATIHLECIKPGVYRYILTPDSIRGLKLAFVCR